MSVPPYYGKSGTCLVCGDVIESIPNGCIILHSNNGNYGSTVWDNGGPSGGAVAFVHDKCFVQKVRDKVILGIRKGRLPYMKVPPDEIVENWDWVGGEDVEDVEESENK